MVGIQLTEQDQKKLIADLKQKYSRISDDEIRRTADMAVLIFDPMKPYTPPEGKEELSDVVEELRKLATKAVERKMFNDKKAAINLLFQGNPSLGIQGDSRLHDEIVKSLGRDHSKFNTDEKVKITQDFLLAKMRPLLTDEKVEQADGNTLKVKAGATLTEDEKRYLKAFNTTVEFDNKQQAEVGNEYKKVLWAVLDVGKKEDEPFFDMKEVSGSLSESLKGLVKDLNPLSLITGGFSIGDKITSILHHMAGVFFSSLQPVKDITRRITHTTSGIMDTFMNGEGAFGERAKRTFGTIGTHWTQAGGQVDADKLMAKFVQRLGGKELKPDAAKPLADWLLETIRSVPAKKPDTTPPGQQPEPSGDDKLSHLLKRQNGEAPITAPPQGVDVVLDDATPGDKIPVRIVTGPQQQRQPVGSV